MPQINKVSDIISLDVGEKKTGLARASAIAKLPEPIGSISTDKVIERLNRLVEDGEVEAVVVGLPRNLSGEDTDQTKWVRDWVAEAKNAIDAPFYFQDEALTSRQAEAHKLRVKFDEDSLAAAIVLQDFLDTPEAGRVMC
jgi:putative Holliday junction resolvase